MNKTKSTLIFAILALVAVSCAKSTSTSEPASPPTTDVHGNTGPRPTDIRSIDFEALNEGQTVETDWVHPCSFAGIAPSQQERYLIDQPIAVATGPNGYVRSDFPIELDVYVYNEGSADGPHYAILNVTMKRLDHDNIEMRTADTDNLIANFVRDTTDPAEWGFCG